MNKLYLTSVAVFVMTIPATAQRVTRRANITGNAVDGECTIQVVVDGAAEVEVQGRVGRLRNLSGQRPTWSRFECNGQMPANPRDFRFRGVDGRGSVQLLQDPRQNGGRIVFRIDDPQSGRQAYRWISNGADRTGANGAARTGVGGSDPILEAAAGGAGGGAGDGHCEVRTPTEILQRRREVECGWHSTGHPNLPSGGGLANPARWLSKRRFPQHGAGQQSRPE